MWSVFTVIAYFLLALLLPAGWALGRVWRKARVARHLNCPRTSDDALVHLDPHYAMRMHARGDRELRVRDCSRWPTETSCGQECLTQISSEV